MSSKKKGGIVMKSLFNVSNFIDAKAVLEEVETEEMLYRVNQMIAEGEQLKAELEEKLKNGRICGEGDKGVPDGF